jgi:hypothetical protein
MGKEGLTTVTTESILLEDMGAEASGSGHAAASNDGGKKDAGKEEEAPPASLGNFFVSTRIWI